jgi:hypothetical protein
MNAKCMKTTRLNNLPWNFELNDKTLSLGRIHSQLSQTESTDIISKVNWSFPRYWYMYREQLLCTTDLEPYSSRDQTWNYTLNAMAWTQIRMKNSLLATPSSNKLHEPNPELNTLTAPANTSPSPHGPQHLSTCSSPSYLKFLSKCTTTTTTITTRDIRMKLYLSVCNALPLITGSEPTPTESVTAIHA